MREIEPFRELDDLSAGLKVRFQFRRPAGCRYWAWQPQRRCAFAASNQTYGDKAPDQESMANSVSKKAGRKEIQRCEERSLMAINEDVV
jgi:hypothetical protein